MVHLNPESRLIRACPGIAGAANFKRREAKESAGSTPDRLPRLGRTGGRFDSADWSLV